WSDMQRQSEEATTEQESFKLVSQTIARVARSGLDRSYFQGIASLVNAIENPEQGAARAIVDLARGFMPLSGFSRNLQRFADPTLRDPQAFTEEMMANLPILSERLPARLGRFGGEEQMQGSAVRRGFLVPEVSAQRTDPVDAELQRLEVFLGVPDRRVNVTDPATGTPLPVTREFVEQVRRGRGEFRRSILEDLIGSREYQRLPDEQKRRALEIALNMAGRQTGQIARAARLATTPSEQERALRALRSRAAAGAP